MFWRGHKRARAGCRMHTQRERREKKKEKESETTRRQSAAAGRVRVGEVVVPLAPADLPGALA